MTESSDSSKIIATKIPHPKRHTLVAELFGHDFPLRLEPLVFRIASAQALNYDGGFWEFFTLSNGGFYMAPNAETTFFMRCPNQYEGELSGDALGIMACLTAYSHLSFTDDVRFARLCATHFHLLRHYAAEHPEAPAIYRAID